MIQNHAGVSVRRLTPQGRECFFGYYDKCPWNLRRDRIIAGMACVSGRLPEPDESLQVGYLELGREGAFHPVGDTLAWNLQQGAMAQWVMQDGEEHIIFNVREGDRAHARLVDTAGRVKGTLNQPVYALLPDGNLAASIDFGRLQRVRPGYGYAGVMTRHTQAMAPEEDGLWLVDLATGESRLAVSYALLAEQVHPRGEDTPHWIDHIEFAPDGRWLVFLHRWIAADGGPLTRLMAMDRDNGSLTCLLDCGSAGHGLWLDDDHYGIWGRKGTLAAKARASSSSQGGLLRLGIRLARRLIPLGLKGRIHQESFLKLNPRYGTTEGILEQIPHGQRGGHPSLRPGGGWVVSDTLPDGGGRRLLFLAHLDGKAFIPLVTFTHDPATANSAFRCDLHPRWDRTGRAVCVDSLHEGFRGMYEIEVPDALLRRKS